jgi:hypothetical protein
MGFGIDLYMSVMSDINILMDMTLKQLTGFGSYMHLHNSNLANP